jgi:hypothetical protein
MGKRVRKGINLDVYECADWVMSSKKPALFHTRRASIGGLSTSLCHPFKCHGGYLVHNGHWLEGAAIADQRQSLTSDTQIMAEFVEDLGFEEAMRKLDPAGVWLWMDAKDGSLQIFKRGGTLWMCEELGAVGSEPAAEGHWFAVANGFYYLS